MVQSVKGWIVGTLGAVAVVVLPQLAQAAITLPETGTDIPGHISAAIVFLGAIVVAAVGGYFAFVAIRAGLRWAKKFAG